MFVCVCTGHVRVNGHVHEVGIIKKTLKHHHWCAWFMPIELKHTQTHFLQKKIF